MVLFDHFVHCCCVMALLTFDEVDLIDFITPSLAATPPCVQESNNESCDEILQILTSKINSCIYFDVVSPKTNFNFSNSLNLVHLNIRSLYKHFDSLCLFLQSLPFKPDVICFTETRVKDQPLANINLPNYSFVHTPPQSNAGGVAVYVSLNLKFSLDDNQYQLHNSESIWLNLHHHENKSPIRLAVIYRHPSTTNIEKFLGDFSSFLNEATSGNKTLYLAGDKNINIDRSSRTKTANDYINEMLSYNVIPIITLPTRVTSRSSSIIDHIITNDVNHNIIPFVIPVRDDLSDHYVVGCCINDFSKPPLKKKQELYVRDKSALNSELFCEDLATNLSIYFEKQPALNTGNYNTIFDGFSQTILSTIDIHAPKKKLSRRQQRLQNKP